MTDLFGVSMNVIAAVSLALTVGILVIVAVLAVRNPVMFKMGLRNIPRRRAQTIIIIVGLMLSTLIMTSAFGSGDTLASSITAEVYEAMGEVDEQVFYNTEDFPAEEDAQVIPLAEVEKWRAKFAGDADIEGFLPVQVEALPIANPDTGLNESTARVVAFRADDAKPFGGLRDRSGKPVTLAANRIAVNESLAREIDARVGQILVIFFGNLQQPVEVVAIVPDSLLTGAGVIEEIQAGAVVEWAFLSSLTGQAESADVVFVTNHGDERSGAERSDAAMRKLKAALRGSRFEAEASKQDGLDFAQLFGSLFTTFFVVFGLFSIAAGILLIFLIFTMLAAERKPEMGMARAVGAKRRQIVESFLAEGLGYDLGSAVVGLLAGMGVTVLMVWFLKFNLGDEVTDVLEVHFSLRGLVVSFCLGVIATFIVIFFASWRASRLNIVAAIRDLPESRPINPEDATMAGYLRGALNAMVAFGTLLLSLTTLRISPLFYAGVLFGLLGPWLYIVRGRNFAAAREDRPPGQRLPVWPLFTGIGTVLYPLAVLLFRVVRDRRPDSVPAWLVVAGIVVPPLGIVLVALQHPNRAIAWSAGLGAVALALGLLCIQWGLDANKSFFFFSGVSLAVLGVAVSLRYFRIRERLTFSLTSALLLLFWYVAPSGRLDWLWGEMEGDIEMFFLSGLVMISAGTFLVVYNADLVLPAVGAFGSRFGRAVPAIKTAIAYPLTARFRTGMTVAMIGLIMFALVMFATLNQNFERVFLNDDARGGFDVVAAINSNNPIDDLPAALAASGIDTGRIQSTAQLVRSWPGENEVEDQSPATNDDGTLDRWDTTTVNGADDIFLDTTELKVERLAAGYRDSRAAWQAVKQDHSLAIIGTDLFGFDDDFGDTGDSLVLDRRVENGFAPFVLTFRDPATGTETQLTVIGVLDDPATMFFLGVFVHRDAVAAAFPRSESQTYFLRLRGGTDAEDFAKQVEAGLVQASSDSLDELLDAERRETAAFLYLFEGFLGLGLVVGIAALGVVSFRAVVERRQQIGMLRAIGYQRGMVALSFIFESSFVALSGILMGLLLAVSLSWVLFTSGTIDDAAAGAGFSVPWVQLAVICAVAFAAALLMTVIPARSASRVAIAEALRYE